MDFLDKRVGIICEQLKKLAVKQRKPITDFYFKKGFFERPEDADASEEVWEVFQSRTMHWYGPDEHYWFRTELTVPDSMDGKSMWIRVRTQIDEWDDGRNPQFLLFVDGKVTQGVDMNHREVKLSSCAKSGEKLQLDLQAYTGNLHGEFRLIVDLFELDETIAKLYYDLWVPGLAFPRMDEGDKVRKDMEFILNEAVNLLDLRSPYSEEFYRSVDSASAYLEKALYEEKAGYTDVIATCIGHTHIDVAWWWTVAQTREKVARSFSTVLKLMEEYPNYKFMSSQPQLYQFLKERYPEVYEQIKERVKEGRWEPEGGMWVEADCNLTSGESLVRQFLHGKRFFKEEFGLDNEILWLPDVFGYSGALPQIMKKSGIKYFMTTKLAWNQFNKVPNDTMLWRGIDGSEILTHLITTLGIGQPESNFFTTYNGMLHPDAIMGGWKRYQNKDMNNDILIAYGYGDGGGGPTREMLETSKRLEKGIKGIPKVRQEFSHVWFEELEERVRKDKRLAVWEGEFYFEYHRGTYTSMARNKRANRKSELGLMDLELFSVMAQNKVPYPKEELDRMWKTVLLNQFHDILPGSSIEEVYEVTKAEYAQLQERLEALTEERIRALTPGGEGITLYNTTGFVRDDIVNLGNSSAEALCDENGTQYPVQQTADGAIAYVKELPAKGYRTFAVKEAAEQASNPFTLDRNVLETPYYRIRVDENGLFESIFDKEFEREVIQEGKRANLFRMYEDKPMCYDNWDIDIYYTEKFWDAVKAECVEWKELGPVRAVLCVERKISNSRICQEICFYADDRRIDFHTWVDWKEQQHLLKVHFPVDVHTDEATFDIQFGNLTRKTHTNTSWDKARFESCGQKWIDVSEGHYGVSLMNDCKYGHSVHDGDLGLTLIKSGIEPNPAADKEEHIFTYSLYPHGETWRAAQTVKKAYFINQPVWIQKGGEPGSSFSLASVDRSNVVIETIKEAEDGDGVILRLYESENARTKATLTFGFPIRSAEECNLMEEKEADAVFDESKISFTIKPYEIKTFRIRS
ncbi:MAG: alpha-mannosidase [Eubacteriales bacterium]|nr:alpha-mannosidase [Eubacteriales bacterium]